MNPFIRKTQYNHIRKYLADLNNTFRSCTDVDTLQTYKACIQDNILNLFSCLSEEEKDLLDLTQITDPLHITKYADDLKEYVYGMPSITEAQIKKLFRKEKKLKLPKPGLNDPKNVYLSWIDEATRKLFIVYILDGKPIGMACRLLNHSSNNVHMCSLCNHVGEQHEVSFVSPICKPSGENLDYRSIGFHICLDNEKCNNRITDTQALEKLLKNVNNLK